MPFLTPDASSDPAVSVALTVPPDLLNALSGAIYELSLPESWEEYGERTPDECATLMAKAWRNLNPKDAVLYNRLIAAWELEEASGVRHDWHGGYHLTDNGGSASRAGKIGNAASFARASGQYLSVADAPAFDFTTKSFSFNLWGYLDDKTTTQRFIRKSNTGIFEFILSYNVNSNRFVWQVSSDGTNVVNAVGNVFGSPAANTWHMLTCWRNAESSQIGLQVNDHDPNLTAFAANIFTGNADLRLSDTGATALNGAIDQVYLFDGVLDTTQIKWLYNLGAGRSYKDVITYAG